MVALLVHAVVWEDLAVSLILAVNVSAAVLSVVFVAAALHLDVAELGTAVVAVVVSHFVSDTVVVVVE